MASHLQRDLTEMESGEAETLRLLPIKPIPGSTGIPFFSPIKDRLDYYYFQGHDSFFQTKIDKYGSTVFRTNMPPGPFMASNSAVITVLDGKSFPILFDTTKVEKKDIFTGTFMPTTKLTGGYRVCSYLDPSEPNHTKLKQLFFNILSSRKDSVIPAFRTVYASQLFETLDSKLASSSQADFNAINNEIAFDFVGDAYFGARPSKVGASGLSKKATIWLLIQLAPLASNILTKFLPWLIEDLLLHTFALPSFIAKPGYKSLYAYFESAGASALDMAEKLGLSREEACHNILFMSCFNTYGGFRVLFPSILKYLSEGGVRLQSRVAVEARDAVANFGENGLVNLAAIEKMDLIKSIVYEVLRIDPPVQFQYGKAKTDFLLESHDALYQVKKGEMLFGYQPFATKDTRVFGTTATTFVPDRFVGKDGAKLLSYVWWSNGPESEDPTVGNKQCAGKNFVVLVARLFVAELFLYYDSFTAKADASFIGSQVYITSVSRRPKLADEIMV